MTKFDLSVFDTEASAEAGSTLQLVHPKTGEKVFADDAEKKPLNITVKGMDSKEFESAILKQNRLNKGKKDEEIDPEKIKLRTCELYAKMTIGWENLGVAFSYDEAVKLYMKHKDIRVQVGNFIGDKRNFIKS
jgi:hypothetical protein